MKTSLAPTLSLLILAPRASFGAGFSTAAPEAPLGLYSFLDHGGRTFTILSEPVTRRVDGETLGSPAGYNVYRRESLRGAATKMNTYLLPDPVFADRIDGKTYFYSIRAVDQRGVESGDSLYVDSSESTNVIFLAGDGRTRVTIPGRYAAVLQPRNNKYGVPLTIRLEEENESVAGNVVRSVRLRFVRGDTGEEVQGLSLPSAEASIQIGYNLMNDRVIAGAPGAAATNLTAQGPVEQLSLYWSNGMDWIKLGGSRNRLEQTVDVRTAQLGRYQLRLEAPAGSLTLNRANVIPKVFTPNGDGLNDRVFLIVENPNNAAISADIYDLSGRHVTTLAAPVQSGGAGATLAWSGQDSSGAVVPSGLYMYRIRGDGKTITGTLSLAR